ncbi:MAG: thioredoxin [Gammaproteobacteria bacterium]|nr:thioredoxin [Gammaproteobacteria bacterium]
MSDSPNISVVTTETFMSDVIDRSVTTPVLIDFWADWCGPCKSLMPILEKLADEYNGAFHLAKINADEEQAIVQQAQIRSLPTVMLIMNGQPVDQFMGALTEGEVREFLNKHITAAEPAAAEATPAEQADALLATGNIDQAYELLKAAQAEDPTNPDILLKIAGIALEKGDTETVQSVMGILPEDAKGRTEAKQIQSLLKFVKADDQSLDFATLADGFAAGTLDSASLYQLGVKQALRRDFAAASDAFFKLLMTDSSYQDGAARNGLLALFEVLGDDPLVGKLRRKMFTLLH